jgi:hypothetical protein
MLLRRSRGRTRPDYLPKLPRWKVSDSPAERAARERFEKWASFYPWDDPDDYGLEKFGGGRYKLLEIQICWEAWKAAELSVARAIEESRQPGLCEKNSPYHRPTSMYCLDCLPPDAPLGALLLSNREPTQNEIERGLEIAKLLEQRTGKKFLVKERADG